MSRAEDSLRSRAEQAAALQEVNLGPLGAEEARRLAHELQVHTLELEMQNEELRRSESELAESRRRYFELYDLAPLGYVTVDQDGSIRESNLTFATMARRERASLVGQRLRDCFVDDDRPKLAERIAWAQRGLGREVVELRLRVGTGELLPVELTCSAFAESGSADHVRITISDISDRRRAEEARKTVEERFQLLAESVQGYIYDIQYENGRQVGAYHSPQCIDVTGYRPEEMLENPGLWIEMVHDADRAMVLSALRQLRAVGRPLQIEHRIVRKDGAVRWVLNTGAVLLGPGSRLRREMGFLVDVTRRRLAEQEVENRGAALRLRSAALDSAANAVMITDPNGNIQWVNQAFLQLTGYELQEIVGKNPRLLKSEQQDPAFYEELWQSIRNRRVWHGELVNRRKDGRLYTEEMTITPVLDDKGEIQNYIAIKQDITDRKSIETALRESQQRAIKILETAADCMITIDEHGIIQTFNPAAENAFGYSADEVIGRNVKLLMPPPFHAEHDGYLKRYVETGVARIIGIGREVVARRKDGTEFPVHLSVGEFFISGRRSFVGILHDITTQKAAEAELRQHRDHLDGLVRARTAELEAAHAEVGRARDLAEQASEAKSRFLAAASHDLRQPLQAANMMVYLLSQKIHEPTLREFVDRLKASMESLGELLGSLLNISRLDAGLIVPQRTVFSLSRILERIENDALPLVEERGLRIRVHPTRARTESDPDLVEQIVRNLVYNAVKYTERGWILIGVRRRQDGHHIFVRDTGVGVPEELQERIFEEFYQVENPARDAKKGIGLGLAIVKRLARMLDHRIIVRSAFGRGSTFELVVPCAGDAAGVAAAKGGAQSHVSGRLIVVIEDNTEVLESIEMLLESWGHTVIAATSAQEAVELARGQSVALILADYRLEHDRTGSDAIREVNEALLQPAPGFLLTGDTSPDRLAEARATGLTILHKPVTPEALREMMDRYLS